MFRSGAHATVALVALAAAVYATASLSGGWLGKPPWWESWEKCQPVTHVIDLYSVPSDPENSFELLQRRGLLRLGPSGYEWARPREQRATISASIAAVGLALFATAAWPARQARDVR